jgi:anti-sigma regulatory factor (Ser/Thr protein kinase)
MVDSDMPDDGHLSADRSVELRVAAKLENLAVLRTLVAAVGTFEDLDFDAVADLRLAVDEACTRLIRSAVPDSTLVVAVHPSLTPPPHVRPPTCSPRAVSAGTCSAR